MPFIQYINRRFSKESQDIIQIANQILEDYLAQGFDLTLRQLYYQFVARDVFPDSWADSVSGTKNLEKNYSKLGSIVNNGRLAGLIDWDAIVDRTREVRGLGHWDSPEQIVELAADQYREDKWAEQDFHIEVWIEKDALVGVISGICNAHDVSYFSCRGYTSQSEMWRAAQRLLHYLNEEKECVIFHLGDHDPSGLDMTRDIYDRLRLFTDASLKVERIALTMDQINLYKPPPNPAKITDTRANDYIGEYGYSSWELDALEPAMMENLIDTNIKALKDDERWEQSIEIEEVAKKRIRLLAKSL